MPETETPKNEGGSLTVGDLRKLVTDTVEGIVGKKDGEPPKDDKPSGGTPSTGGSIADEVRRQVARIKEKEEREKRDADIDSKLSALEEKTKVVEKQPIERRRVHKIMGWGEPD